MCNNSAGAPDGEPSSPNFTVNQNSWADGGITQLWADPYSGVSVKDPATPPTQLSKLTAPNVSYTKSQDTSTVGFGNYSGITFKQAVADLSPMSSKATGPAPDPVPDAIPAGWLAVNQGLDKAINDLQGALGALEASGGWQGATHDAVVANVTASVPILKTLSAAAGVMSILSQAFGATMSTTWSDILPNDPVYEWAMNYPDYSGHIDDIKQKFDSFAQKVMTTLQNNMVTIAGQMPVCYDASPAQVSPTGLGNLPNGLGSSPTGSGSFPSGPPGGSSAPAMPNLANLASAPNAPKVATTSQIPTTAQTAAASQVPTNASAASAYPAASDMQGLSSLGQGLTSPLQSALGAMNSARAAQAANPAALANNLGKLPKEGALALGKGAKGGAGGIGARSPALAKPASAPRTAAGTAAAARTVAAASRAGLIGAPGSPGTGGPGAGSPAAGQHGGAAHGVQHQPSKVLRNKKNGQQIIGDAEAVVAVLGEPARADAPPKPDAT